MNIFSKGKAFINAAAEAAAEHGTAFVAKATALMTYESSLDEVEKRWWELCSSCVALKGCIYRQGGSSSYSGANCSPTT